MKKFKKITALSLALAMGLSLAACGGSSDTTTQEKKADDTTAAPSDNTGDTTAAAADEATAIEKPEATGDPIYVYSWNTELGGIIENYFLAKYPEYKDLIKYVNLECSGTDGVYAEKITNLLNEGGSEAPDLMAFDSDVVGGFIESDYIANVADLGITPTMYADAYEYTIAHGTYDGNVKALSWQATPGCFVYRADIAKEVLGTDDPDQVQESVKDWDTFFATADKMKEAGYKMLSGADDIKYVVTDQRSEAFVKDDTLKLDDSVKTLFEYSKKLYDGGYTNKTAMWNDAWNQSYDGDVFGWFGTTWFTYWSINTEKHVGDFRLCTGPAKYHWGGSYMVASSQCKNKELAAFVMYTLTCDADFMAEYFGGEKLGADYLGEEQKNGSSDFVNNKKAVEKIIAAGAGACKTLGDQNPVSFWADYAASMSIADGSAYDADMINYITEAMTAYNEGKVADPDAAIKMVKDKVSQDKSFITVE